MVRTRSPKNPPIPAVPTAEPPGQSSRRSLRVQTVQPSSLTPSKSLPYSSLQLLRLHEDRAMWFSLGENHANSLAPQYAYCKPLPRQTLYFRQASTEPIQSRVIDARQWKEFHLHILVKIS